MPAELQKGNAVLWGVGSTGFDVDGFAAVVIETAKAGHKFKLDNVEDETGTDAALIATNGNIELNVTFIPAKTGNVGFSSMPPLTKVTLSNFTLSSLNGDYVYIGDGSVDLSHKEGKVSLKLRKYSDSSQNASLTTTV